MEIKPIVDCEELRALRVEYTASLRGPQEAWLEEQLHVRDVVFHLISRKGEPAGYACIDASKRLLLQVHVSDNYSDVANEAFGKILAELTVQRAYVTTRDSLALSLCLTHNKQVRLESYLFEHRYWPRVTVEEYPEIAFRRAVADDRAGIDDVTSGFFGDVGPEIEAGHMFVAHTASELLGFGYLSEHFCTPGAANLGVFTTESCRCRNVGSFVLENLAQMCRENSLQPIAACYHENIASRRALEKAGFVARDRMFLVSF